MATRRARPLPRAGGDAAPCSQNDLFSKSIWILGILFCKTKQKETFLKILKIAPPPRIFLTVQSKANSSVASGGLRGAAGRISGSAGVSEPLSGVRLLAEASGQQAGPEKGPGDWLSDPEPCLDVVSLSLTVLASRRGWREKGGAFGDFPFPAPAAGVSPWMRVRKGHSASCLVSLMVSRVSRLLSADSATESLGAQAADRAGGVSCGREGLRGALSTSYQGRRVRSDPCAKLWTIKA